MSLNETAVCSRCGCEQPLASFYTYTKRGVRYRRKICISCDKKRIQERKK